MTGHLRMDQRTEQFCISMTIQKRSMIKKTVLGKQKCDVLKKKCNGGNLR